MKNAIQQPKAVANSHSVTIDEIVHEINDRKSRENNIVMFNIPEVEPAGGDGDTVTATNILNFVSGSRVRTDSMKCFRLGKAVNPGKCRPLKVVLGSAEERKIVLTNAKKLKDFSGPSKLFIARDLTIREMDTRNGIMSEYRTRRANGENISLKYVSGMPRIIEQQKNVSTSNSR